MKTYTNIEDWRKDWTLDKQKLFQEIKERKYGKTPNDSMTLINDKELSEITSKVTFIIPIKLSIDGTTKI